MIRFLVITILFLTFSGIKAQDTEAIRLKKWSFGAEFIGHVIPEVVYDFPEREDGQINSNPTFSKGVTGYAKYHLTDRWSTSVGLFADFYQYSYDESDSGNVIINNVSHRVWGMEHMSNKTIRYGIRLSGQYTYPLSSKTNIETSTELWLTQENVYQEINSFSNDTIDFLYWHLSDNKIEDGWIKLRDYKLNIRLYAGISYKLKHFSIKAGINYRRGAKYLGGEYAAAYSGKVFKTRNIFGVSAGIEI